MIEMVTVCWTEGPRRVLETQRVSGGEGVDQTLRPRRTDRPGTLDFQEPHPFEWGVPLCHKSCDYAGIVGLLAPGIVCGVDHEIGRGIKSLDGRLKVGLRGRTQF